MKPPATKFEALQAICRAVERGEPVPGPAAVWLADGIAWYLENEGASLDEALLLKPQPGGAHATVWQESRYTERNRRLHMLAASLQGISWQSAEIISGWLKALRASGSLPPEPTNEQAVNLHLLHLLDAPTSVSQIWRILKETAYLHITPDYSQVELQRV